MKRIEQTNLCVFALAGSLLIGGTQSLLAGPLLKLERRTNAFDLTVSSLSATGALFIFQATNLEALVVSPSLLFQTNNPSTNDVSIQMISSGSFGNQAFFFAALWPNMAFIPAGSFTMGTTFPSDDAGDELPLHTVYVSGFCMDKYDVTKALWDEVKTWGGGNGYSYGNAGSGKAANHPVNTINWYDTLKWCNARSQKDGLTPCYYTDADWTAIYKTGQVTPYVKWDANGYRLPTEAEWEKAARGGASGHRFPWADADTISWSRANYYAFPVSAAGGYAYDINPTAGTQSEFFVGGYPHTSPVGYFPANGYGLYDMAGNVFQWCWDFHNASWYAQAGAREDDTRGPLSSPFFYGDRETRCGGWDWDPWFQRCAKRGHQYPEYVSSFLGFRCVSGL